MRRRVAAAAIMLGLSASACSVNADSLPGCDAGSDRLFVLAAQAVPSATLLPCVAELPSGWTFGGSDTRSGMFQFWLNSDRAGLRAAQVTLQASCIPGTALEVTPAIDEVGTRRFEQPLQLPPSFAANRYYRFTGGCVIYEYRFAQGAPATLALEADQALTFRPRQPLVDELRKHDLVLCGAGAPPCPGGD